MRAHLTATKVSLKGAEVFFHFCLALVVLSFSPGQGQLKFGLGVFKIKGRRHDSEFFGPGAMENFLELLFVQEELTLSALLVILNIAKSIVRDVNVVGPGLLAGIEGDVRFTDAHLAPKERFDFRALEGQARFKLFDKLVVVGRLFVAGDDFNPHGRKTVGGLLRGRDLVAFGKKKATAPTPFGSFFEGPKKES